MRRQRVGTGLTEEGLFFSCSFQQLRVGAASSKLAETDLVTSANDPHSGLQFAHAVSILRYLNWRKF